MVEFAQMMAIMLDQLNADSFQNFELRIGTLILFKKYCKNLTVVDGIWPQEVIDQTIIWFYNWSNTHLYINKLFVADKLIDHLKFPLTI